MNRVLILCLKGHDPAVFIFVSLVSIMMSHKEKVLNYMFNRIKRILLRTDVVMFMSAKKKAELSIV